MMDPAWQIALSIATFIVGLWAGDRLALSRDRRKEFNDAALPIREWLLREIDRPSALRAFPTLLELDLFESCLSRWRRRKFRAAWNRNLEARRAASIRNSHGEVLFSDTARIISAMNDCLAFTRRR